MRQGQETAWAAGGTADGDAGRRLCRCPDLAAFAAGRQPPRGRVLFEPDQVSVHGHFPRRSAMASFVAVTRTGHVAETVTVGCESAAGAGADSTDTGAESFLRGVACRRRLARFAPALRPPR